MLTQVFMCCWCDHRVDLLTVCLFVCVWCNADPAVTHSAYPTQLH